MRFRSEEAPAPDYLDNRALSVLGAIEMAEHEDAWAVYSDDHPFHVPLNVRLEWVNQEKIPVRVFSEEDIEAELGVSAEWVRKFSLSHRMISVSADGEPVLYPGYAPKVLGDEVQWIKGYEKTSDTISVGAIAKIFDRHPSLIKKMYESEGLKLSSKARERGIAEIEYEVPKAFLLYARKHYMAMPWSQDLVSINRAVELTGRSKTWVYDRIDQYGIDIQERRSRATKRMGFYIYPYDLDRLLAEVGNQPMEADRSWVTRSKIRDTLGRGDSWVDRNLRKYEGYQLTLLDSMGRPNTHYPVGVLDKLTVQSEWEHSLPEIGDRMGFRRLVELSGRSMTNTRRILEYLGIKGELRRNGAGRISPSYSKSDVEIVRNFDLKDLKEEYNSQKQVGHTALRDSLDPPGSR